MAQSYRDEIHSRQIAALDALQEAGTPVRSFKVGVFVSGEVEPTFNALRFRTPLEAENYAGDLFSRWMAAKDTIVLPTGDEPNTDGVGNWVTAVS